LRTDSVFLFEDCGHAFYSLVGVCSFYRSSFDAIAQVASHFNGYSSHRRPT
jgi:hypothetical protein